MFKLIYYRFVKQLIDYNLYVNILHIIFVSYNKPTFKNVQLEVDDHKLLDIINILFFFSWKWYISCIFHELFHEILKP